MNNTLKMEKCFFCNYFKVKLLVSSLLQGRCTLGYLQKNALSKKWEHMNISYQLLNEVAYADVD